MQNMQLKCPNCREVMTLDIGFSGGVCRCRKCGELVLVPTRPDGGGEPMVDRKERPIRPDVPGAEPIPTRADAPPARPSAAPAAAASHGYHGGPTRPAASVPAAPPTARGHRWPRGLLITAVAVVVAVMGLAITIPLLG